MFEKALIRRSVQDDLTSDFGLVAETLLFYRHVHWMLDRGTLIDVVRKIGLDGLFSLIDSGHVKATFLRDMPVVYADSSTGIVNHDFVFISIGGKNGNRKLPRDDEVINDLLTRALDDQKPSRKQVRKFLDKVPFRTLGPRGREVGHIGEQVREDASDDRYVNTAIRSVLKNRLPGWEVPSHWTFRLIRSDRGFIADTNFDFSAINKEYHKSVAPSHSSISSAFLLCSLWDARTDIFLSSDYISELVTDPWSSGVINIKLADVLRRRSKSNREIEAFQELTLNNGRAVREAINSNHRSFSEFLDVLERAAKFKEWLSEANPDAGHLTDYYRRVCESSWLDTLPAKILRFSFFSAAGAGLGAIAAGPVGLGLGVATGAADTFLFDKFLRGWTPNQFIKRHLEPFARRSD